MRSASEYGAQIRGLLINQVRDGILRRQVFPLEIRIGPDNRSGQLYTHDPGVLFNDGATLEVEEVFVMQAEGGVERERYFYDYRRPGGYYFRFEREQHDEDLIYKPEYHLHVLWRLPHFPAPPLTLEGVLNFIRINFYSPHRQRLVGYPIDVEI